MSNIIRSVAGDAGFVPEYWAQRSLDVLRARIVLAGSFARDTDYEPGWRGKTLHIGYPGTFSTVEKAEDTPLTPQTPSNGSMVSLVLNHLTVVPFALENYTQAVATPGIMDRYIESASIGLVESIESTLYTDVVANFTATGIGTAGTDVDAALVRSAKVELDNARAPMADRYLVLAPKDAVALLGDSSLATFWAFSAAQSGIRQGELGQLYGFTVLESQLAPVVTGTPNTTTSAAFHQTAGLIATRPLPAPMGDSGVLQASAVDGESGLSVTLQAQFDVNNMAMRVNLAVLWGAISLRPSLGIEVTS